MILYGTNESQFIADPYLSTTDENYSALNQNRDTLKGKTFRAN
jgi:hypothetical protein